VEKVLEKYYRRTGKPMRRCHPRDVLTHALNLIRFERLPPELTNDVMDRAFSSCFLEEEEEGAAAPASPIVVNGTQSCAAYWSERLAQVPTISGTLALLAALRDAQGNYSDRESERDFDELETEHTLTRLHSETFFDWLKMNLEQQSRDLLSYFAMDARAAGFARNRDEWIGRLTPAGASFEERELFRHDFCLVLDTVVPQQEEVEERPRLERIA